MTRKPFRLAAAAISALAITSMCAAPSAMADTTDQGKVGGTSQQAANPALINADATVQLNIEKHLGAPTGETNNGTAQTVTTPKLQGVNFDVYQVEGVDLTTNAGWETASALQSATVDTPTMTVTVGGVTYQVTKVTTVTTDETGTATFTKDNGVGLYYVQENLESSGTITDLTTGAEVKKSAITPSKPFFVTLPMTNPENLNSWMYDVRVYPKNQADSVTKEVLDGNAGVDGQYSYVVGQKLTYQIDGSITAVERDGVKDENGVTHITGADIGYYFIGDKLPEGVDYVSSTVQIVNKAGELVTPALTEGDDYVLTTVDDIVKMSLTMAGLDKIAAHDGGKVRLSIVATVASVPDNGILENTANLIPSNDWWVGQGNPPMVPGETPETPEEPGIPSNPVESKFGDIIIEKYDPAEPGANVAGAEFAIYLDKNFDEICSVDEVQGTGILDKATVALDEELKKYVATFKGLQASNWYNNKEQTLLHGYCVVETKAPAGYNLDATPRYVSIDYTTGTPTVAAFADLRVANEKTNLGNELPLTGGEGIAALSLGGLALIGGGAAYYAISSRKRREA